MRTGPGRLRAWSKGRGGLIASACLHLCVLAALALLPTIAPLVPTPEESISVEVVTREAIAPPPAPKAPEAAAAPPVADSATVPPTAPAQPPAGPPPMVRARKLLSDAVLADARSREARATLSRLEDGERIEQLCNLEAMSQLHEWKAEYEPDRVVAYAMAATRLSRSALKAVGAAFRSKGRWYGLVFDCTLTPDRRHVAGFAFQVGEAVPRREWDAHGLPPIH